MQRDELSYWQRWSSRRLSRRSTLVGGATAGVGLAAAGLVGCGGDDNTSGSTKTSAAPQPTPTNIAPGQGQQAKDGGHYTAHMGGSPRTLDPHFDTFPYNTAITDNTNNGLLKFSPDLTKVETDLASALPEQPDGLTYVFKIPQGVKFHDVDPVNGREFTADDVKRRQRRGGCGERLPSMGVSSLQTM